MVGCVICLQSKGSISASSVVSESVCCSNCTALIQTSAYRCVCTLYDDRNVLRILLLHGNPCPPSHGPCAAGRSARSRSCTRPPSPSASDVTILLGFTVTFVDPTFTGSSSTFLAYKMNSCSWQLYQVRHGSVAKRHGMHSLGFVQTDWVCYMQEFCGCYS